MFQNILVGEGRGPAATPMPATFGGRYLLERAVSTGVVSVIWRAKDLETERPVALKFFPPQFVRNPMDYSAAQELVAGSQRVRHPGVVMAHDVVLAGRYAAFVTPWVEGPTLRQMMYARPARFFEADDFRRWLSDLLDTIEHAHAHDMVHGALGPDVVLQRGGEIFVVGFGINAWLRRMAARMGRPPPRDDAYQYLSPAQRRSEPPRAADDVYALGALIYESLVGAPPRRGMWWRHHRLPPPMVRERRRLGRRGDEIPAAWERAVLRCLEPRERDRMGSARELRFRLELGEHNRIRTTPAATAPAATASPPVAPAAPREAPPRDVPAPPPAAPAPAVQTPSPTAPRQASDAAPASPPLQAASPPASAASASAVPSPRPPAAGGPGPAGHRPTTPGPPSSPRAATFPRAAGSPAGALPRAPVRPPQVASEPGVGLFLLRGLLVLVVLATLGVGGWFGWNVIQRQQHYRTLLAEVQAFPLDADERVRATMEERVYLAQEDLTPDQWREIRVAWQERLSMAATPEPAPALRASPPSGSDQEVAATPPSSPPSTPEEAAPAAEVGAATEDHRVAEPLSLTQDPQVHALRDEASVAVLPTPRELEGALTDPDADGAGAASGAASKQAFPREDLAETLPLRAPLPEPGVLEVNTDPPGAEVRVGDRPPQQAPARIKDLAPGVYPVDITRAGYAPFTTTVEIASGEVARLDASLQRLTGTLRLESEPAGVAFGVRSIDGGGEPRQGLTPASFEVPTGRYVVVFRQENRGPRSFVVDVGPDRPAVARVTFPVPEPPEESVAPAAGGEDQPSANGVPVAGTAVTAAEGAAAAPPPAATPDADPIGTPAVTAPPAVEVPATNVVPPEPSQPSPPGEGETVATSPATGPTQPGGLASPETEITPAPPEVENTDETGAAGTEPQPPVHRFTGIYELTEVDTRPKLIERVDPDVPRWRGRAGRVELIVIIDRTGRVASAAVRSTTHRSLVSPCLRAVRLWRFSPAIKEGQPVPVRVAVPLVFSES